MIKEIEKFPFIRNRKSKILIEVYNSLSDSLNKDKKNEIRMLKAFEDIDILFSSIDSFPVGFIPQIDQTDLPLRFVEQIKNN